jgi:LysM repeat protein
VFIAPRRSSAIWIGPGQMFSSLAKRFIILAALCIPLTGLPPSIASATHNGSWDETTGKRCSWKTPKPQDILPPNATAAKLRDSPLSSSELDAMEHDVEEKIDSQRRSVGLQTIDRVDASGVHHGWSSCISAAAAYHSADMILLNKLNQHDIRRSWITSNGHVATTTPDDRLRAYGVNFRTSGEIVSCATAFPGFPSTRAFAHEAMYGSQGWMTRWSKDHSDTHYPIILGGYQLPNTRDNPPNWTYAGVGVAAGYVPALPADIQDARSQGKKIPSGGLIRVTCVTVDFVIPSRVMQAPQPTQTMTPAQMRYTVVSGDTLSSIARRFKVSGGWQQLYRLNSGTIADPNHIYPGQVLVIP